jgi:sugar lactone lactonase YvrE
MRRLTLVFVALVAVAALVALPSSAHKGRELPKTIDLPFAYAPEGFEPLGFQPEGIVISGNTFYVGSIVTGAIYSGDVRTGQGSILVEPVAGAGRAAIGVDIDKRKRLFVAGGGTGKAFVYDARNGDLIREYTLTTLSPRFINDVVVTPRGAYFTDSNNQQLYLIPFGRGGSLGDVQTIPLTGDLSFSAGFNLNGIDATESGRWLVVVQSNEGLLFRVNPRTGVTRQLELTGGDGNVRMGDGILLDDRKLFVVQNRLNKIAVIRVDRRLREGTIKRYLTDLLFDVPTTIDDVGQHTLYAVNARFGNTSPMTARYNLIRVDTGGNNGKDNGHKKHR